MKALFDMPWSTFGAIVVLLGTIVLALVWAFIDKQRDREDGLMLVYVIVLVAYLGLLVAIGIVTSGRSRNAGDFAIGGRSVGPWVTALSFVAAYYSSVVIIGGGAFGWKFGLSTLWVGAGNVLIGTTLAWIILGRRVRRFTENLDAMTLPGFFAGRYRSAEARIFSAAATALFLIIYNVSVLKGMANSFEVLMDLPYWAGVVISGVVILFYTAVGGYLAVVYTSFVQGLGHDHRPHPSDLHVPAEGGRHDRPRTQAQHGGSRAGQHAWRLGLGRVDQLHSDRLPGHLGHAPAAGAFLLHQE